MRRKPTSQNNGGYNGQQRNKPRYQNGGHGASGGGEHRSHNSGHHNSGGRPRKNYAALREKYLSQARDALAAGDRVLAENYFQHADHCYRMMVEEGYQVRNNYTPPPQSSDQQGSEQQGEHHDQAAEHENQHQGAPANEGSSDNNEGTSDNNESDHMQENIHQLPAFLTNFDQTQAPAEPVIVPSWEE